MKTLFRTLVLVSPILSGALAWWFLHEISIAVALGYIFLLYAIVYQRWPKKEWLSGEIPEVAANARATEKVHLTGVCHGRTGELEEWLFEVCELAKQQALKSYMHACFWKEETKSVLNDINHTLLRTILIAIFVSFSAVAVIIAFEAKEANLNLKSTTSNPADAPQTQLQQRPNLADIRLVNVAKILGAWIAPSVQITYLAALCLHVRKRNAVV